MNHVMKFCSGVALLFVTLVPAAEADEFRLSNNQRISCSRGLSAGKLNTATCKSYAYIFNVKTSEYYRCGAAALTLRQQRVINVRPTAAAQETHLRHRFSYSLKPKPRRPTQFVFNRWLRGVDQRQHCTKVRGCIIISSASADISKCLGGVS